MPARAHLRLRVLGLLAAVSLATAAGNQAAAQSPTPDANAESPATVDEIENLIGDIQVRIDRIDRSTTGADTALDILNEQVDEAIAKLTSRLDENAALRDRTTGLTSEVETLAEREENLEQRLARLTQERDGTIERLETQLASLADQLALETGERDSLEDHVSFLTAALGDAKQERERLGVELETVRAAQEDAAAALDARSQELAVLERDIAALRTIRTELETQVAALNSAVDSGRGELDSEQARSRELSAALDQAQTALVDERKRSLDLSDNLRQSREELLEERNRALSLAERLNVSLAELADVRTQTRTLERALTEEREKALAEIEAREARLSALLQKAALTDETLATERAEAAEVRDRVTLLNDQLVQLKQQLVALNQVLDASEARNAQQKAQIVDLGSRLNQALATRVQELANYRSEFFGRLREVLGNRSDVRVVGDRFVFQSEVLFATGEAELGQDGQDQLRQLASTLAEIATTIPDDVDWVLRVDGHTDDRPIRTPEFPSNWELSAARALSVVKFLIDSGIPAERLVAAGFGQFHPLDQRRDEIGFRRNRRIEFKLTQR